MKVATPPKVRTRAPKAFIRRAKEGVQPEENEEMGEKIFTFRHQLESNDSTVRKIVCSGWYPGQPSTIIFQMLHYTVEAKRDASICSTNNNSARWSNGSSRWFWIVTVRISKFKAQKARFSRLLWLRLAIHLWAKTHETCSFRTWYMRVGCTIGLKWSQANWYQFTLITSTLISRGLILVSELFICF